MAGSKTTDVDDWFGFAALTDDYVPPQHCTVDSQVQKLNSVEDNRNKAPNNQSQAGKNHSKCNSDSAVNQVDLNENETQKKSPSYSPVSEGLSINARGTKLERTTSVPAESGEGRRQLDCRNNNPDIENETCSRNTECQSPGSVKRQSSLDEAMVFNADINVRKSCRLKSSHCASRYRGDYGIRVETYTKLTGSKTVDTTGLCSSKPVLQGTLKQAACDTMMDVQYQKGDLASISDNHTLECCSTTGNLSGSSKNLNSQMKQCGVHSNEEHSPGRKKCCRRIQANNGKFASKLSSNANVDSSMNSVITSQNSVLPKNTNKNKSSSPRLRTARSTSKGKCDATHNDKLQQERQNIEHNSQKQGKSATNIHMCSKNTTKRTRKPVKDSSNMVKIHPVSTKECTNSDVNISDTAMNDISPVEDLQRDNNNHSCDNCNNSTNVPSLVKDETNCDSRIKQNTTSNINETLRPSECLGKVKKKHYCLETDKTVTGKTPNATVEIAVLHDNVTRKKSCIPSMVKCKKTSENNRSLETNLANDSRPLSTSITPSMISSPDNSPPSKVLESLRQKLFAQAGVRSACIEDKPKQFEEKIKTDKKKIVASSDSCSTKQTVSSDDTVDSVSDSNNASKSLDKIHRTKRKHFHNKTRNKDKIKRQKFEDKKFFLRSMLKRSPESDSSTNIQDSVENKKLKVVSNSFPKQEMQDSTIETIHRSENHHLPTRSERLTDEKCQQSSSDKVEHTSSQKTDESSCKRKKKEKTNKPVKCCACDHMFRTKDLLRKHYPCSLRQTRTLAQNVLRSKRALKPVEISKKSGVGKFVNPFSKSNKHLNRRPQLLTPKKNKYKFKRVKGKRRRRLFHVLQELISKRKQAIHPPLCADYNNMTFKEQFLYRFGLISAESCSSESGYCKNTCDGSSVSNFSKIGVKMCVVTENAAHETVTTNNLTDDTDSLGQIIQSAVSDVPIPAIHLEELQQETIECQIDTITEIDAGHIHNISRRVSPEDTSGSFIALTAEQALEALKARSLNVNVESYVVNDNQHTHGAINKRSNCNLSFDREHATGQNIVTNTDYALDIKNDTVMHTIAETLTIEIISMLDDTHVDKSICDTAEIDRVSSLQTEIGTNDFISRSKENKDSKYDPVPIEHPHSDASEDDKTAKKTDYMHEENICTGKIYTNTNKADVSLNIEIVKENIDTNVKETVQVENENTDTFVNETVQIETENEITDFISIETVEIEIVSENTEDIVTETMDTEVNKQHVSLNIETENKDTIVKETVEIEAENENTDTTAKKTVDIENMNTDTIVKETVTIETETENTDIIAKETVESENINAHTIVKRAVEIGTKNENTDNSIGTVVIENENTEYIVTETMDTETNKQHVSLNIETENKDTIVKETIEIEAENENTDTTAKETVYIENMNTDTIVKEAVKIETETENTDIIAKETVESENINAHTIVKRAVETGTKNENTDHSIGTVEIENENTEDIVTETMDTETNKQHVSLNIETENKDTIVKETVEIEAENENTDTTAKKTVDIENINTDTIVKEAVKVETETENTDIIAKETVESENINAHTIVKRAVEIGTKNENTDNSIETVEIEIENENAEELVIETMDPKTKNLTQNCVPTNEQSAHICPVVNNLEADRTSKIRPENTLSIDFPNAHTEEIAQLSLINSTCHEVVSETQDVVNGNNLIEAPPADDKAIMEETTELIKESGLHNMDQNINVKGENAPSANDINASAEAEFEKLRCHETETVVDSGDVMNHYMIDPSKSEKSELVLPQDDKNTSTDDHMPVLGTDLKYSEMNEDPPPVLEKMTAIGKCMELFDASLDSFTDSESEGPPILELEEHFRECECRKTSKSMQHERHFLDIMNSMSLKTTHQKDDKINELLKPASTREIPFSRDSLLKLRADFDSLLHIVPTSGKTDPKWLKRNLLQQLPSTKETGKYAKSKEDVEVNTRYGSKDIRSASDLNDICEHRYSDSDEVHNVTETDGNMNNSNKGSITDNVLQMLTSFEDKGSIALNMSHLLNILDSNLRTAKLTKTPILSNTSEDSKECEFAGSVEDDEVHNENESSRDLTCDTDDISDMAATRSCTSTLYMGKTDGVLDTDSHNEICSETAGNIIVPANVPPVCHDDYGSDIDENQNSSIIHHGSHVCNESLLNQNCKFIREVDKPSYETEYDIKNIELQDTDSVLSLSSHSTVSMDTVEMPELINSFVEAKLSNLQTGNDSMVSTKNGSNCWVSEMGHDNEMEINKNISDEAEEFDSNTDVADKSSSVVSVIEPIKMTCNGSKTITETNTRSSDSEHTFTDTNGDQPIKSTETIRYSSSDLDIHTEKDVVDLKLMRVMEDTVLVADNQTKFKKNKSSSKGSAAKKSSRLRLNKTQRHKKKKEHNADRSEYFKVKKVVQADYFVVRNTKANALKKIRNIVEFEEDFSDSTTDTMWPNGDVADSVITSNSSRTEIDLIATKQKIGSPIIENRCSELSSDKDDYSTPISCENPPKFAGMLKKCFVMLGERINSAALHMVKDKKCENEINSDDREKISNKDESVINIIEPSDENTNDCVGINISKGSLKSLPHMVECNSDTDTQGKNTYRAKIKLTLSKVSFLDSDTYSCVNADAFDMLSSDISEAETDRNNENTIMSPKDHMHSSARTENCEPPFLLTEYEDCSKQDEKLSLSEDSNGSENSKKSVTQIENFESTLELEGYSKEDVEHMFSSSNASEDSQHNCAQSENYDSNRNEYSLESSTQIDTCDLTLLSISKRAGFLKEDVDELISSNDDNVSKDSQHNYSSHSELGDCSKDVKPRLSDDSTENDISKFSYTNSETRNSSFPEGNLKDVIQAFTDYSNASEDIQQNKSVETEHCESVFPISTTDGYLEDNNDAVEDSLENHLQIENSVPAFPIKALEGCLKEDAVQLNEVISTCEKTFKNTCILGSDIPQNTGQTEHHSHNTLSMHSSIHGTNRPSLDDTCDSHDKGFDLNVDECRDCQNSEKTAKKSKMASIFKRITELGSIETDNESDLEDSFDGASICHNLSTLKALPNDGTGSDSNVFSDAASSDINTSSDDEQTERWNRMETGKTRHYELNHLFKKQNFESNYVTQRTPLKLTIKLNQPFIADYPSGCSSISETGQSETEVDDTENITKNAEELEEFAISRSSNSLSGNESDDSTTSSNMPLSPKLIDTPTVRLERLPPDIEKLKVREYRSSCSEDAKLKDEAISPSVRPQRRSKLKAMVSIGNSFEDSDDDDNKNISRKCSKYVRPIGHPVVENLERMLERQNRLSFSEKYDTISAQVSNLQCVSQSHHKDSDGMGNEIAKNIEPSSGSDNLAETFSDFRGSETKANEYPVMVENVVPSIYPVSKQNLHEPLTFNKINISCDEIETENSLDKLEAEPLFMQDSIPPVTQSAMYAIEENKTTNSVGGDCSLVKSGCSMINQATTSIGDTTMCSSIGKLVTNTSEVSVYPLLEESTVESVCPVNENKGLHISELHEPPTDTELHMSADQSIETKDAVDILEAEQLVERAVHSICPTNEQTEMHAYEVHEPSTCNEINMSPDAIIETNNAVETLQTESFLMTDNMPQTSQSVLYAVEENKELIVSNIDPFGIQTADMYTVPRYMEVAQMEMTPRSIDGEIVCQEETVGEEVTESDFISRPSISTVDGSIIDGVASIDATVTFLNEFKTRSKYMYGITEDSSSSTEVVGEIIMDTIDNIVSPNVIQLPMDANHCGHTVESSSIMNQHVTEMNVQEKSGHFCESGETNLNSVEDYSIENEVIMH